jgi:hypothetical protein
MKKLNVFLISGFLSLSLIVISITLFAAQPVKNSSLSGGPLHHNTPNGSLNSTGVLLYDQIANGSGGIASQDFETSLDAFDCKAADDFIVPAGKVWSIDEVVIGFTYNGTLPTPSVNIHIQFFKDNAGVPGTLIHEFLDISVNSSSFLSNDAIPLPSPVVLDEGVKWVSVQMHYDFTGYGQTYWSGNTVQTGNLSKWINPGDGFGNGSNWINCTAIDGINDRQFAFWGVESEAVPFPLIGSILAFLGIGGASFFGLRKKRKN